MKKISIVFIAFICFLSVSSCNYGIKGNGNVTEEERNIGTFDIVEIGGVFNIYLSQGDEECLKIEIDDNLHQYILTEIDGNVLKINTKEKINFNKTKKKNIYLTVKDIQKIRVNGACNINTKHQLLLNNLEISVGGVCDGDFNIKCNSLDIDIYGVSDCIFKGSTDNLNISVSGTSDIDAKDLIADKVIVKKSGIGEIKVNAVSELNISLSGVGDIEYYGNPTIKNIKKSGVGDIVSK